MRSHHLSAVMPALVAGIHVFLPGFSKKGVDGRDKPGHDSKAKETIVRKRCSGRRKTFAIAAAMAVICGGITRTSAQAPLAGEALKTPWGEPDLQGIWTDESDTPLQRPAKYAAQEFFTAAQRAELDEARAAVLGRDRRAERGSENGVASGYNSAFWSFKRIGPRTSLIAAPPNSRKPAPPPPAQKIPAAERGFRLPMLQSTETCNNNAATS